MTGPCGVKQADRYHFGIPVVRGLALGVQKPWNFSVEEKRKVIYKKGGERGGGREGGTRL